MKKKIVIALSIILMLSMVGCGKKEEVVEPTVETEVATEEVSEEITEEAVEEETTAAVTEESTEVSENTVSTNDAGDIVKCNPTVLKYTNTNSNVRSTPNKAAELVGKAPTNTQVEVTGVTKDGSWSQVSFNGLQSYIKSSLLSNHMQSTTKAPKKTTSGGTVQSVPTPTAPAPTPTPTQNETYANDPYADGGTVGDMTSSGGTTGSQSNSGYHGY